MDNQACSRRDETKSESAADRKALKVAIREIKLEVVWKISCSSVEFTKLFCAPSPLIPFALSPRALPPSPSPSIRIRTTGESGSKNARRKTLTKDRLPPSFSRLKRVTRRWKTFHRQLFRNSPVSTMDATRRVNRRHSKKKKKEKNKNKNQLDSLELSGKVGCIYGIKRNDANFLDARRLVCLNSVI